MASVERSALVRWIASARVARRASGSWMHADPLHQALVRLIRGLLLLDLASDPLQPVLSEGAEHSAIRHSQLAICVLV